MPPKKPQRKYHQNLRKRSQAEDAEIKQLEAVIEEQAPQRGSNPLAAVAEPGRPSFAAARKFEELPLSSYTKDALQDAKFVTLTAIQRAALPHALCGRDVLGAAKTGSGKTLAFLIPLVETLYRRKWNRLDGLGALVVSPTRELAMQIFEELRRVGRRHELSAGLLLGGKDVGEEAERVAGMNVLVATPGRLLQHMDETPGFDAGALQVLVLDEADRILDMGFSATLNAILANLPRRRQTLLFSATQTKSVAALARLSLNEPEYIEAHAEAEAPTPVRLEQAYMECEAAQKLDILWSFIRTHLKARTIVFLSTCKQVRFVYEAFRRLRPGVPLRALHGRMSQYKRMAVYQSFCAEGAGVLFATDVAARGLDFPAVDWVVQGDCPEDVAGYIHRVGRTARYTSSGRSLLLLTPGEREGMLAQLAKAKVPVKMLRHNPSRMQPVTPALQALLSKDAELKETAQRALVSYLRSVFLQPNRAVFDVTKLPAAELALSMGLPTAPKLRFLRRAGGGGKGGDAKAGDAEPGDASASESDGDEDEEAQATDEQGAGAAAGYSSDDDLLVVKRRDIYGAADQAAQAEAAAAALTKAASEREKRNLTGAEKRKKRLKISASGGAGAGTRVVFNDEGQEVDPLSMLGGDDEDADGGDEGALHAGAHATVAARAAAARAVMAARDQEDRAAMRELRKAQRDGKRARRLAREQADAGAALGGSESDSGSEEEEEEEQRGGRRSGRLQEESSDSESEGGRPDLDLLLDSDDDEGAVPAAASGKARHVEAAHLDMAPAAAAPGDGNKRKRGREAAYLTLAEQEALALQLLRR